MQGEKVLGVLPSWNKFACTNMAGNGQERVDVQNMHANVRGAGEDWIQRNRQTLFAQQSLGEKGVDRASPFAPAAVRNPQVPLQANIGTGPRYPAENR
jgi:hypothetical protein